MTFEHVPPQWPKKLPTKISFVAEAPSWEELEKGAPLVGPSGKMFNSMLRTAKLDRSSYHVTNVFDVKIPDNKIKNWCVPLKEAREQKLTTLPPIGQAGFLRAEYRYHLERLGEELRHAAPTVIVPLGATALWAFTGQANISQMRGTAMPATRIAPGVKLVPTYHPMFVMKQFPLYQVVVRDLMYAAQEANKPEVHIAHRELLLEPTIQEIKDYIPRLLASKLLSVDIETDRKVSQITCIALAPDAEHAICIPFYDERQPDHSYWRTIDEEMEALRLLRFILDSPVPKLGQNFGGYDFIWLLRQYHLPVRNLSDDTRLLSHARYPELPKDLGFLGSSFASQGAWKYMGKTVTGKRDDAQ